MFRAKLIYGNIRAELEAEYPDDEFHDYEFPDEVMLMGVPARGDLIRSCEETRMYVHEVAIVLPKQGTKAPGPPLASYEVTLRMRPVK